MVSVQLHLISAGECLGPMALESLKKREYIRILRGCRGVVPRKYHESKSEGCKA